MASTVINDPEAIRMYRTEINNRIIDLKDRLKSTDAAIERCNQEGWKDGNFKQFQQNFEQEKTEIGQLCEGLRIYYDDILANLERKLRGYTDESSFSLSH